MIPPHLTTLGGVLDKLKFYYKAGERIEGEMDRTRESGSWGSSF